MASFSSGPFATSVTRSPLTMDREETLSRLPDTANVEDKAEQNLRREKLLDCIALLGEPDSSIIVYFYYYGIKTHKIASLLGMSSSNVQQRLSRARKKLKKLLALQIYKICLI